MRRAYDRMTSPASVGAKPRPSFLKHWFTELLLQSTNLLAHRRLRPAHPLSCPVEATQVLGGYQHTQDSHIQIGSIHNSIFRNCQIDTVEHLGLIRKDQKRRCRSTPALWCNCQSGTGFRSGPLAFSSTRHGRVTGQFSAFGRGRLARGCSRLLVDTPLGVAELCSEMCFLSHESWRVVLVNTTQELIKDREVTE